MYNSVYVSGTPSSSAEMDTPIRIIPERGASIDINKRKTKRTKKKRIQFIIITRIMFASEVLY